MPIEDDVGYSETTPIKIEHLERIFSYHLAVTQAVLNKNPQYPRTYHYVDLTAGKGFTPDGTKGSPITFLEQAESSKISVPYKADLIEKNPENAEQLRQSVSLLCAKKGWSTNWTEIYEGDYQQKAFDVLQADKRNEHGLVFVDTSGNVPDFEILGRIAILRPRMEILVYLSSTNVKRLQIYTGKNLADLMGAVNKKYWLLRKPALSDAHKWIFLLGSNGDLFKEYKSIDFYRLDSEKGQEIFPKVNLTKKQNQRRIQPGLFDDDESSE